MLKFKYCECGCKGSETEVIAGHQWWYFDDLMGNVFLHSGHGRFSPLVDRYKSVDAAIEVATKLAKEFVVKELELLTKILEEIEQPPEITFAKELSMILPGKNNKGLRMLIRRCKNTDDILALSRSSAFTAKGKSKLEQVVWAFERRFTCPV